MTSVGFLLHTDELDAQDFVRKEWDACKSRRTYDSEESILVEVMNGKERECKSVYLESMTVKYINYYEKTVAKGIAKTVVSWFVDIPDETKTIREEEHYISLPSALTDGFASIHKDDHLFFSGWQRGVATSMDFVLPLLPLNKESNVIPQEELFFYSINGVNGATLAFQLEDGSVKTVYCSSNCLLFHSTQSSVKVVKALKGDRRDWEYYELLPYRSVTPLQETRPFLQATKQTKLRDRIVEDTLLYNIPTLIEGVTSSGKTFTVEQYCMHALLPLVRYNFSPSSTIEELLGDIVITKDSTIKYMNGPFTDAFVFGKILLLDEMSLAQSTVVQSILSFLFSKQLLYEASDKNEERKMHPFFRVIATQSPAGSSYKRSTMSDSIRDCFRVVTHDEKKEHYFPMIKSEERCVIITGMFKGDAKIGKAVSDYHERAEKRKDTSKEEIYRGKDYTLRDCSRLQSLMKYYVSEGKREDVALKRAAQLAYNLNDINEQPLVKAPQITFSHDRLDEKRWMDVYDRVVAGIESGCHILLVGKTEYDARKYCHAILEEKLTGIIHCSSSSSTENIIGSYTLKEQNGRMLPVFEASPLLNAIKNGGVCVLQSMETMKSNVIERLNSILELCPADGRRHVVRFDENREEPDYEMRSDFRVVATTSEKGLLAFSPALRNRFLEVYIGNEEEKYMKYSMEVKEEERILSNEEQVVEGLLEDCKENVFEYQRMRDMLLFFKHSSNLELDANLLQVVEENQPFLKLAGLGGCSEKACELLKCLSLGKASVLHGPKGCGKTRMVNELLRKINNKNHRILHVSSETDFTTLMGSIDTRGVFNEGVLYRAAQNGELVVFENAENMTSELIEMLDALLDPFASEFYYPTNGMIHPAFRCLFVFTSRREKLEVSLPAFFRTVSMDPISTKRAGDLVKTDVCRALCKHIEKGEITMEEIFVLDEILSSSDKPVLVAAGLFADREDRKKVLMDVVEEMKVDEETAQSARLIMDAKDVVIERSDGGKGKFCSITRGDFKINTQVLYDEIVKVDMSIRLAVFTACLTSFKKNRTPLLLVGDPDITSEVNRLLAPSSVSIELSRSIEMAHIFGEVSLCHLSDLMSIFQSLPLPRDYQDVLLQYRQYLENKQAELEEQRNEENSDPSALVYRPGPLLKCILGGVPLLLSNINLLNDRLLCRLYGLLFNLSTDEFVLFEDNTRPCDSIVDDSAIVMVSCDTPDYSRVERKERFLQVFCPPFSPLEVAKYEFQNREQYSLSILRKAERVRACFVNPSVTIPDYLSYLQSDTSARHDLQDEMMKNKEKKSMSDFLYTARDAKVAEVMLETSTSLEGLLSKEILDSVWDSLNVKNQLLPTKTTIQLLLSVALADRGNMPVILEGDPGVGKTAATENYLLHNGFTYKRINFSNSTTTDTLFGCYTIVDGNPTFKDGSITELLVREPASSKKALLFDEVNLAPSDVLEMLLTLIRCYANHTRFQIPGSREIDLPEKLLIVCCMNPASMSANRSILPRRFYSYCLYHRGLSYSLSELFCTAKSILNTVSDEGMDEKVMKLFQYSYESGQKTSIPFSLRDVLKVQQICTDKSSDLSLEAALWLVFACRYEESDRKEVERILGKQERVEYRVIKSEEKCTVTGFWNLDIPTSYDSSFREYALSTSENLVVYKLSMALRSKRAILVYGASPSGKSYSIKSVAQMHGMPCRSVFLNHDSTPDSFIGRNTISKDGGKENLVFRPGPLVEAMQNGTWVVIEDIHLANNDVMECLNSLCEENPTLKVTQGDKEVTYVGKKTGNDAEHQVVIKEGFRMFFTISEDTLKHFTGPFLSRCVIVYCDSIANALNVQEICQAMESKCDPRWFGEDESKRFRRCIRVMSSKEKDAFKIEFEKKPTMHALIHPIVIPPTIMFELWSLHDNMKKLPEEKKVAELSRVLLRLVHSTPRSFDRREVVDALKVLVDDMSKHFIAYIVRKMVALLNCGNLENTILKRQPNENAVVLRRWSCASFLDIPFKKGFSINDIDWNEQMSLTSMFDVDFPREYELLLLNYVCGREQYCQSFEYPETQYLVSAFFSYLDSCDVCDDAVKNATTVLAVCHKYKELHELCDGGKKMKRNEAGIVAECADEIVKGLNGLPVKNEEGVEMIIQYCNSKKEEAEKRLFTIDDDEDDEETRKCAFDSAKRHCNGDARLEHALHEAFDGRIDNATFKALRMNQVDMDYSRYEYKAASGRFIAKISHCIYKLKQFNCPVFILNEYVEVLSRLELRLPCMLAAFSEYESVKESVFVLLNALLMREMSEDNKWWESILQNYSQYPFYSPVYHSKEEIEKAVDELIENGWYDSYVEKVKQRWKRLGKYEELKEKLLNELCLDEECLPERVTLKLPLILKAIDEEKCDEYSVDEISAVQNNWTCDLSSEIGAGSEIPSIVLQREGALHTKMSEMRNEMECVWQSALSMREKLMVVCPRKRTALGRVVLDILKSKDLRDTAMDVLKRVDCINELVSEIQRVKTERLEEELERLKGELKEARLSVEEARKKKESKYKELMKRKDEIVKKFTLLAKDRNTALKKNKELVERNKRALHFYAYLSAVNTMDNYSVNYNYRLYESYSYPEWRENLKDKYSPYSFQVVAIDREWLSHRGYKGDIEITILPPDHLSVGMKNNSFRVNKDFFGRRPLGNNFYYVVLPLAPFKWTAVFNDVGDKYCQMKYYCREKFRSNDLGDYSSAAFTQIKLLKRMIECRERFKLFYSLPQVINQRSLYSYCQYNSGNKPDASSLFVAWEKCVLHGGYADHFLCGEEITSDDQIVPMSEMVYESVKVWKWDDYVYFNGYSATAKSEEAKEDAHQYNECYEEYQQCSSQHTKEHKEATDKQDRIRRVEESKKRIEEYFFPGSSAKYSATIDYSKSLKDAVVFVKENEEYHICLPRGKEYRLPENYPQLDGSTIILPVINMCSGVAWSVESDDCIVSVSESGIVVAMDRMKEGENTVHLTVKLFKSGEVLAEDSFSLSFRRTSVPKLIRTSCECSIDEWSSYYKNILYPSVFPVKVWVDGKARIVTQRINYYGSDTAIVVDYPCVKVSRTTWSGGKKGTMFTYGEKGKLGVFSRSVPLVNPVVVSVSVKVDPQTTLMNLQSHTMTEFLSGFTNLSMVLLSCSDKERRQIASILSACIDSPHLLPSIKKRAQDALSVISKDQASLRWVEDSSVVRTRWNQPDTAVDDDTDTPAVSGRAQIISTGKGDDNDDDPSAVTYTVVKDNRDIDNAIKAIIINMPEEVEAEEKEENKPDTKPTNQNTKKVDDYRGINYRDYLKIMEKQTIDRIFENAYSRRGVVEYIHPKLDRLIPVSIPQEEVVIDESYKKCVISAASRVVYSMMEKNTEGRSPYQKINLIIDTNYSHKPGKARLRTLATAMLIVILRELGVRFDLFLSCGRKKFVQVDLGECSVDQLLAVASDVEGIVKIPSTPLDLLSSFKDDSESVNVIIGDGFSEQLMSRETCVTDAFIVFKDRLFLLCIVGSGDEALSGANQTKLESCLKANFGENMVLVKTMEDLVKSVDFLSSCILSKKPASKQVGGEPVNAGSGNMTVPPVLNTNLESPQSAVLVSTITAIKKATPVDIRDADLNYVPMIKGGEGFIRGMSGCVKPDNYFDSLNLSIFVPNKASSFVAATSGTSIIIAKYIKYLVTKSGDGKFFKKLGSAKTRFYNCGFVIDCSSLAFSETNRAHSFITLFTLLRNISNLQLPCVDIWVATDRVVRVATGVPSADLWETPVIAAVLEAISQPVPNTVLQDCLRYACCTCNSRSFSSVMMVCTNGVLCKETREEVRSIVSTFEMSYVGVGIGSYLCGFHDLFPSMIWHANPLRLSDVIASKDDPSRSTSVYGVEEKKVDSVLLTKKNGLYYDEMVKKISDVPSEYELEMKDVRIDDVTDRKNGSKIGDVENNSQYDLGADGGFTDYTILFVVLYLCRGEKDSDGSVIDEDITEEVLVNGKEVNGKRFSPVLKLGPTTRNGKPIGKGFNIEYAYDYKTAIDKLLSGKIRVAFITCSPGDGEFPKSGGKNKNYCNAFLETVNHFYHRGGGVFWFLENYPYTYEADLYFKKFYGYEIVKDKEKSIDGGRIMTRVKSETPDRGHFVTYGGDVFDMKKIAKLDFGLTAIYEGETLCEMDEENLMSKGFRVFARESTGCASIVFKPDGDDSDGRMVIDTAASKLFKEFTFKGTARWISNAAVWLCNTGRFNVEKYNNPSARTGIDMSGLGVDKIKTVSFVPREQPKRAVDFCLTVVMDTTGSMSGAINSVKVTIEGLLRKLESIKARAGGRGGAIVGQMIQYKDYSERSRTDNNCSITSDFSELRSRLEAFDACGGGDDGLCGGMCEDMQYGVKCALANMRQSQYKDYYHMMIITGDYPCHGDDPNRRCYNATNPKEGRKINDLWSDYFSQMKSFENLQVWFMPISPGKIRLTYNRFNSNLKEVHITGDTSGDQLKTVFDDTITEVYSALMGISARKHYSLCFNHTTAM